MCRGLTTPDRETECAATSAPSSTSPPPATEDEVRSAALQYVRKVSGSTRPSAVNTDAFELAVEEIAASTMKLLGDLSTSAPPKDRAIEAEKARERWRKREARTRSRG